MFHVKQAQFEICLRHVLGSADLLSRAIWLFRGRNPSKWTITGYLPSYFVSADGCGRKGDGNTSWKRTTFRSDDGDKNIKK